MTESGTRAIAFAWATNEEIVATTMAARTQGVVLMRTAKDPPSLEEKRALEEAIGRYVDCRGEPVEDAAYGRVQDAHAAVVEPPFPIGMVVATAGVDAIAKADPDTVMPELMTIVQKHQRLDDRGNLMPEEDLAENRRALETGQRIVSKWKLGEKEIYAITEWDRGKTTLLLEEEY